MNCSDADCARDADPGLYLTVNGERHPLCPSCFANWSAGFAARSWSRARGEDYNPVEVKWQDGKARIHVRAPGEESHDFKLRDRRQGGFNVAEWTPPVPMVSSGEESSGRKK